LGAGYAIGIVGDAGVRGTAQQPRLFVGMILILIFSEVNCLDFFDIYSFFLGLGSIRNDRCLDFGYRLNGVVGMLKP
jgi:hypothetical protein